MSKTPNLPFRSSYVIVKSAETPFTFTKFYATLDDAVEEAKRLTEQENRPFMVFRLVGETELPKHEIKFNLEEGFWEVGIDNEGR